MGKLEKTIYTSGAFAFEAFGEGGTLYQVARLSEYIILKVSNITANQQKIVSLGSPLIESDLEFKQIRLNRAITGSVSVTIDIYRGTDFIEQINFTEANLPYVFPNGTVIDPHNDEYPVAPELRITSNKTLDALYLICGKCYTYPVLELQNSY